MAATPADVGDELFAALQKNLSSAQLAEPVSDLAMGTIRSRFNRVFDCRPAGFSPGGFLPAPGEKTPPGLKIRSRLIRGMHRSAGHGNEAHGNSLPRHESNEPAASPPVAPISSLSTR